MADWGPQTVNLTRDCDDIHHHPHQRHYSQNHFGEIDICEFKSESFNHATSPCASQKTLRVEYK